MYYVPIDSISRSAKYFINVTYLCKHVLSMCSDLYCVDLGLDEIIQHMSLTINMTVAKGF